MGVVGGPVDDVAADQHLFPTITMRPERTFGDDRDVHVSFGVRVHGQNVINLREVVDCPVEDAKANGRCLHHVRSPLELLMCHF